MVAASRSTILFALLVLAGCSMSARDCALLSDEQLQRINLNAGDCHDEWIRRADQSLFRIRMELVATKALGKFRNSERPTRRECENLSDRELVAICTYPSDRYGSAAFTACSVTLTAREKKEPNFRGKILLQVRNEMRAEMSTNASGGTP